MSKVIAYGITDRDYKESPFPERVVWYATKSCRDEAQEFINEYLQWAIEEELSELPDLIAVPFIVAEGNK